MKSKTRKLRILFLLVVFALLARRGGASEARALPTHGQAVTVNSITSNFLLVQNSSTCAVRKVELKDAVMELRAGKKHTCLCRMLSFRTAQVLSRLWPDGVFRSYEIHMVRAGWHVQEVFGDYLGVPDSRVVGAESSASRSHLAFDISRFEAKFIDGTRVRVQGMDSLVPESFTKLRHAHKLGDGSQEKLFLSEKKNIVKNLTTLPVKGPFTVVRL